MKKKDKTKKKTKPVTKSKPKKEDDQKEKLNDGGDINRAESTYIPEVDNRETAKDMEESGYIG